MIDSLYVDERLERGFRYTEGNPEVVGGWVYGCFKEGPCKGTGS